MIAFRKIFKLIKKADDKLMIRMKKEPLLRMVNVCKRFGKVQALKNVDFDVGYNECVGLLGDNGAGKSTLVKCLMGVYPMDEGDIYFMEKRVHFRSAEEARKAGIEVVYQDANLIEMHNVWRNFFLGKEETRKPFNLLDVRFMREKTMEQIKDLGIRFRSPDEPVAILSGGERQSISIGRASYFKASLLVLDEPTTALSVKEREKVLNRIEEFKRKGLSFIFITHNVFEVFPVADKFEILDRGVKVASLSKTEDLEPEMIVRIVREGKVPEKLVGIVREGEAHLPPP